MVAARRAGASMALFIGADTWAVSTHTMVLYPSFAISPMLQESSGRVRGHHIGLIMMMNFQRALTARIGDDAAIFWLSMNAVYAIGIGLLAGIGLAGCPLFTLSINVLPSPLTSTPAISSTAK